jgi:hypothetical protein
MSINLLFAMTFVVIFDIGVFVDVGVGMLSISEYCDCICSLAICVKAAFLAADHFQTNLSDFNVD